MSKAPLETMHVRFFDMIEVIVVENDGTAVSMRRWVSESERPDVADKTLRRAHEMARNVGGLVIGSSPTVLGDYRQP
jgi:hypothetical protein